MGKIVIASLIAGIIAIVILVVTWNNLAEAQKVPAVAEMFKLTYQFIIIVVGGGLISIFAKKIVDDQTATTKQNAENEREKAHDQKAQDELRKEFLRRIVQVGQTVRTQSLTVAAFRSATSYRDAMLEILKARSELAIIAHEIGALNEKKKQKMVSNFGIVEDRITKMSNYIDGLSKEFCSIYKDKLSELQIKAEEDRSKQSAVWKQIQELEQFGPLINYDQDFGEKNKNSVPNSQFFFPYHDVVKELRQSLD